MQTLRIDDKWSVQYDPNFNYKPLRWLRYGEHHSMFNEHNAVSAMFYRLLELEEKVNNSE